MTENGQEMNIPSPAEEQMGSPESIRRLENMRLDADRLEQQLTETENGRSSLVEEENEPTNTGPIDDMASDEAHNTTTTEIIQQSREHIALNPPVFAHIDEHLIDYQEVKKASKIEEKLNRIIERNAESKVNLQHVVEGVNSLSYPEQITVYGHLIGIFRTQHSSNVSLTTIEDVLTEEQKVEFSIMRGIEKLVESRLNTKMSSISVEREEGRYTIKNYMDMIAFLMTQDVDLYPSVWMGNYKNEALMMTVQERIDRAMTIIATLTDVLNYKEFFRKAEQASASSQSQHAMGEPFNLSEQPNDPSDLSDREFHDILHRVGNGSLDPARAVDIIERIGRLDTRTTGLSRAQAHDLNW